MRGLKVFETNRHFLYTHRWLTLKKKKKIKSLIKYYNQSYVCRYVSLYVTTQNRNLREF